MFIRNNALIKRKVCVQGRESVDVIDVTSPVLSHPVKSGPLAGVSPSGQQPYKVR